MAEEIMTSSTTLWEEILGSKDWSGLLKPNLDVTLRDFLIRSAVLCQASYDAFVSDQSSGECGNTRYSKSTFFSDISRLQNHSSSFSAHSFLYASSGVGDPSQNLLLLPVPVVEEPWDRQTNWMGYVAVTTDEASRRIGRREIHVVWRGTLTPSEWTSNVAGFLQTSAGPLLTAGKIDDRVRVHRGWYDVYTSSNQDSAHAKMSARLQLKAAFEELMEKYKDEKEVSVVVTGHSLGGALATLSAFDLVENSDVGPAVRVAVVVFGCPQVGNEAFKRRVEAHPNLNILHVNNAGDLVPQLPDSALPFYIPIATAEIEIEHSGKWYEVSQNHSLTLTLEMLTGANEGTSNNGTTNAIVLQTA